MIFFGHLGLTLGAAKAIQAAAVRKGPAKILNWLDYRILLLGSLLPDLVDKPIALLFHNYFNASRLYAHTLLFSVILITIGIIIWKRYRQPGALVLAAGSFFHQILDRMWAYPATFYWPYYGWNFPATQRESFLKYLIYKLTNDPYTYIPEVAGFVILAYYIFILSSRRHWSSFIKKGRL